MYKFKCTSVFSVLIFLATGTLLAQNPIIMDQFTADPTARIFDGKVYLYPSHDIVAKEGQGRPNWFCMEDYHVFSSENLVDWTDHGVIVSQTSVPWARPDAYSMWAPDCFEKDGKYYFYFPTAPDSAHGRGFAIGVAIADDPAGPFRPEPKPMENVHGIDPNVFMDEDGQAYLYWSAGHIFGARLKSNMLELDSEPVILADLPSEGLKEGPFVFERSGVYYLTFPHVENKTERLEYAIGDHPLGPFKMTGVIMDESPTGCWTNHHSFVQYNNQWYLFYHHNDLSPQFDKNRSVRIDSMFFNADGTIQKVKPTLRGVGITKADSEIQIDRYSQVSERGVTIAFVDTLDTFKGWKTEFHSNGAWVQYNAVEFGDKKLKAVILNTFAPGGGSLEIRAGSPEGTLLSKVKLNENSEWKIVKSKISNFEPGVRNLYIISKSDQPLEIDWIKFGT